MTITRQALIAVSFIALLSAPAQAADAEHGGVIARRWCADCHVVASDQKRAKVDAPPFADVAKRLDDKKISAFLTDPHPKMPDMSLSRKEIEDITAYIRSLDPTPRAPAAPTEKEPERPRNG